MNTLRTIYWTAAMVLMYSLPLFIALARALAIILAGAAVIILIALLLS